MLLPYLEFANLSRRIDELAPADVSAFRQRWADSPLADRLFANWLDALIARDRDRALVEHFEPTADVGRTCAYLRALMRLDRDEEALAQVPALWLVGHSQDKRCDPLFAAWIKAERLTEQMVWQRVGLALEANERNLAEYLTRYLTGPRLRDAKDFIRVNRNPSAVTVVSQFRRDQARIRTIVDHGLRRLARIDAEAAKDAWSHYEEQLSFEPTVARIIDQDISRFLARKGILTESPDLSPLPDNRHLETAEALVVAAVGQGESRRAIEWIRTVDPNGEGDIRWRYWLGRALSAETGTQTSGRDVLTALAKERNYYGFMAAERVGLPPQLNADEPPVEDDARARAFADRGFARVRELYAVGDNINARREWRLATARLDQAAKVAAVLELAAMGWVDLSVIAAGEAGMTDHLSARFPRPYATQFKAAATRTGLPISLLYGITRQESAFGATAVSPAGALGLMQLMPPTAALTARSMGIGVPSRAELLTPEINIQLGSRHLAKVMARYDGNRILAAASYNAGEHRVDRWLRERPYLAADIWVDMIPYLETRNYVKGVLAFSWIYGQLLGMPEPFLTAAERGTAFEIAQSNAITSSALNGQSISLSETLSTGMRVP